MSEAAPEHRGRHQGAAHRNSASSIRRAIAATSLVTGGDPQRRANVHVPTYRNVGLPSGFLPVPVTRNRQRTRGPAM